MRKPLFRSAIVSAGTLLGLGALTSVAIAAGELSINEMPAQKTTSSTCATVERQGSSGYAMQNRNGVSRVYEFAGYSTDPQGYRDMRVNVYVDGGNWLQPGGWSKGDLLGFTFIGCS